MATFTNRTINRSSFLFWSGHKAKIYCLVVKFPGAEIFRLLVTIALRKKSKQLHAKKVAQYGMNY